MIVIVTGGRNYFDKDKVNEILSALDITLLVQGGANGADRLAREYALENFIALETIEADWNKHGRAAGPIRNREMLIKYPKATVIAFPGGRGTENCVNQAKQLGMSVWNILV